MLGHLDRDLAVVDEQPVAGADLVGQLAVGARDPVVGADDVVAGDDDGLAVGPHRPGRRRSGRGGSSDPAGRPGCRPAAPRGRGLPHPVVALLVLGVVTVTEVQPGHVHAGADELADAVRAVDGGTERTDDLRATIHDATLDSGGGPPFGPPRSAGRTSAEHRCGRRATPRGATAATPGTPRIHGVPRSRLRPERAGRG